MTRIRNSPPPIQLLILLGSAVLVFALVLGLVRGLALRPPAPTSTAPSPTITPTPLPPTPSLLSENTSRADPVQVHSRIVLAIRGDDPGAVYNEYLPGQRPEWPAFRQEWIDLAEQYGPTQEIRLTSPPMYADERKEEAVARIDVVREKQTLCYLFRYRSENGRWWLHEMQLCSP